MPRMRIWETLHALVTRLGTNTLTGQTAVIVGASSGLGLELARQLARAGCKLAISARDASELEHARRELVSSGTAVFARPIDASRPDQVEDFVHATLRRFGSLDMLITCAEATEVGPLESIAAHDVEQALEQVFWSAYHPTMAVVPHMRTRRAGRIVHVSAWGGRRGMPYGTARSALRGFSTSLRAELARDEVSITVGTDLPLTSLSAEHTARRILHAAALGHAESRLPLLARALVIASAMGPNLMPRRLHGHVPSVSEASLSTQTGPSRAAVALEELMPLTSSPSSLLRASSGSAN